MSSRDPDRVLARASLAIALVAAACGSDPAATSPRTPAREARSTFVARPRPVRPSPPSVGDLPSSAWSEVALADVVGIAEVVAVEDDVPRIRLAATRALRGPTIESIRVAWWCNDLGRTVESRLLRHRRGQGPAPLVLYVGRFRSEPAETNATPEMEYPCDLRFVEPQDPIVRWTEEAIEAQRECLAPLASWSCPPSTLAPYARATTQDVADALVCGRTLNDTQLTRSDLVGCIGRPAPRSDEERFLDAVADHVGIGSCGDRDDCRSRWIVALHERHCSSEFARRRGRVAGPPPDSFENRSGSIPSGPLVFP